jgi:hypothetical protein
MDLITMSSRGAAKAFKTRLEPFLASDARKEMISPAVKPSRYRRFGRRFWFQHHLPFYLPLTITYLE